MLSARPDHCGQFVDVNPAMAALLGCQPAELLGRSLTDFLKPGDRVRYEALLSRLLATRGGRNPAGSSWSAASASLRAAVSRSSSPASAS